MTGVHAARAGAELAIERFIAATDSERLVLYRMHLQSTIRAASPLTLDLAEHLGVDLGGRLDAVRPPSQWPWRSRTPAWTGSTAQGSPAARHYIDPKRCAVHGMLRRHAVVPGFVHFGDGDDLLAFHFRGPWLSMEGCIGACHVRVAKGMAALTLPAGIPETLVAAMVGRDVDAVVGHPALAGRGYVVRRVRDAGARSGPTLVFATGRRRFAMPWPELLGSGAAGTSADHRERDRLAGAGLAEHAATDAPRSSLELWVAP